MEEVRSIIEQEWLTDVGLLGLVIAQYGLGHRCGYVRVEQGHPCFGKSYDEIEVDVHGGLTYSEFGCHGHEDGCWYIGFDCGHCYDGVDPSLRPDPSVLMIQGTTGFWTTGMVARETANLARQLQAQAAPQEWRCGYCGRMVVSSATCPGCGASK